MVVSHRAQEASSIFHKDLVCNQSERMKDSRFLITKRLSPGADLEMKFSCQPKLDSSGKGKYLPAHWFPHVGQNYSPDYALQDFEYFVVIDFEATCDRGKVLHPQEIIEFPSVLVNSQTGQLEDSFQIYVRPTHNQLLTEFCKELTGIQQSQVEEGVLLSEALQMHDKWLEDKGIKNTSFAIVTWSNWDCRVMLESECRFKSISKPAYFNRWINLKIPICAVFPGVRPNLQEAVELAGLSWEGRPHCGLDDAKNTARLLTNLMHRGFKFSITNTIQSQTADPPPSYRTQTPSPSPSPSPPDYGYFAIYKSSSHSYPPFATLTPSQPTKDPQVFCYCGVRGIKRLVRDPGSMLMNMFFVCGNSNSKRGAVCPFLKLASGSGNIA